MCRGVNCSERIVSEQEVNERVNSERVVLLACNGLFDPLVRCAHQILPLVTESSVYTHRILRQYGTPQRSQRCLRGWIHETVRPNSWHPRQLRKPLHDPRHQPATQRGVRGARREPVTCVRHLTPVAAAISLAVSSRPLADRSHNTKLQPARANRSAAFRPT